MGSSGRWRRRAGAVLGAAMLVAAAGCDFAVGTATGQLDPTFGDGDGYATWAGTASSDDRAQVAARLPDGKVVVAAQVDGRTTLVRYLPDGSPDPAFGEGGVAPVPAHYDLMRQVAVVGDDIVLTGFAFAGGTYPGWKVTRFQPDGSPDPGFGVEGQARFEPFESVVPVGLVHGVVPSGDGLLLLAERGGVSGLDDGVVVRLGAGGVVDTAFGPDGSGTVRVGQATDSLPSGAIGALPGGAAVVSYRDGTTLGVRTVSATGALGPATPLPAAAGLNRVDLIDVGPDGSVLVAGRAGSGGLAVVRLTAALAPDPAFGIGGVAVVTSSALPPAPRWALARSSAGIVLAAAGSSSSGGGPGPLVTLRLTAGGALDPGYGDGGIQGYPDVTEVGGVFATAGGALVAGSRELNGRSDLLLLAVDAAGAPDPAFGDGGRVVDDLRRQAFDRFTAVASLPGGGLLVAGDTGDGLVAGRYDAAGTPDADHPPAPLLPEVFVGPHVVRDAAVDADGAAYLLVQEGSAEPESFSGGGGSGWRVVKLGADGEVDEAFGDGGIVHHDGASFPNALAVRDGRVLVAWTVVHPARIIPPHGVEPASFDLAVDALTTAGAVDTSFGDAGRISDPTWQGSDAPPGPPFTGWLDLDADGNAYLALGPLLRLSADGDTLTTATLPAGVSLSASDVAVAADGAILATGEGRTGATAPTVDVVARFDGTLALDPTYGTGGLAALPAPANAYPVASTGPLLLVGGDGSATVVEQARTDDLSAGSLVLRRVGASGAPATAFGGDGRVNGALAPGGAGVTVVDVALQGGDVVVAGARADDAAVARVNG